MKTWAQKHKRECRVVYAQASDYDLRRLLASRGVFMGCRTKRNDLMLMVQRTSLMGYLSIKDRRLLRSLRAKQKAGARARAKMISRRMRNVRHKANNR